MFVDCSEPPELDGTPDDSEEANLIERLIFDLYPVAISDHLITDTFTGPYMFGRDQLAPIVDSVCAPAGCTLDAPNVAAWWSGCCPVVDQSVAGARGCGSVVGGCLRAAASATAFPGLAFAIALLLGVVRAASTCQRSALLRDSLFILQVAAL